jgi:hypothetical protein
MYHSHTRPFRLSRRPRRQPSFRAADDAAVVIRHAAPSDARELDRLAALDERSLPLGERLVGVLDGRVVAALEVDSGTAVADPFVPTEGVVELLGLRAAQVRR